MRFHLLAKGLWTPDGQVVAADEGEGALNDAKALGLIGRCVETHHYATIANCRTSLEAWAALEEVYRAQTVA